MTDEPTIELFGEERAVSPVIGVILMVAITVILAAVIGTFVLDLGEGVDQNPQAGVSFDNVSNPDGVEITLQSIQRADSIEVDCGNGNFYDWEDDVGKSLEAGVSVTCDGSEIGSYVPTPGDTITVRATYDGNTEVLQRNEVE